jgi:hypothetical protein
MRHRQAHISCGICPIVELVCDQELINLARTDCRNSQARVADLALFSPNETLDDISTQDLVYLFLPHVSAEIETRARAIERDERLTRLREAQVSLALPLSNSTHLRKYIPTLMAARIHKVCVRPRTVRNHVQVRARIIRHERVSHRQSRQTARDKD